MPLHKTSDANPDMEWGCRILSDVRNDPTTVGRTREDDPVRAEYIEQLWKKLESNSRKRSTHN